MTHKKHLAALKKLIPKDWEIHTGHRHIKLKSPEGFTVTVGSTISDHRAMKNVERDIRATLRKIEEWKAKKAKEPEAAQEPGNTKPKKKNKGRRRGR